MALISCPECGKQISETTPSCPHCGYRLSIENTAFSISNSKEEKNTKNSKNIFLATIILFVLFSTVIYGIKFLNSDKNKVSIQTIAAAIELNLDGFSNHNVTTDNNVITVDVWNDSLTYNADRMKELGFNKNSEEWISFRDSFISLSKSMTEVCKESGRTDISTILNVKNSTGNNNTFLTIRDGTVIYDAMN